MAAACRAYLASNVENFFLTIFQYFFSLPPSPTRLHNLLPCAKSSSSKCLLSITWRTINPSRRNFRLSGSKPASNRYGSMENRASGVGF